LTHGVSPVRSATFNAWLISRAQYERSRPGTKVAMQSLRVVAFPRSSRKARGGRFGRDGWAAGR
jgi:hypothetical protein